MTYDRRRFLRMALGAAAAIPTGGLVLSACGRGDEPAVSPGTPEATPANGQVSFNEADVIQPLAGLSAPLNPGYFVGAAGPVRYGSEFGLNIELDDFTFFDSHTTATQATLAGRLNVMGASTLGHLVTIASGAPFRIFAPFNDSIGFVIAARGELDSLDDLLDDRFVVGVDDVGGAAMAGFDAILIAENAGFLTDEIANPVTLGSSGLRQSALASGEVDATIIHLSQALQVDEETGDVNIVANVYEGAPQFKMQSFMAANSWLDENPSTAIAWNAGIIRASRELKQDFQTFREAVHEFIPEPAPDDILEREFEVIQQYPFYPDDGGLAREKVEFMIELGERQGILEEGVLTYEQAVDTRYRDAALELLDG